MAMTRRPALTLMFASALSFCWTLLLARPAQPQQSERPLDARAHIFPGVGPGLRAIQKDSAGRYYILNAPGQAVRVFDAKGQPAGLVPPQTTGSPAAKQAAIGFGLALDVDSAGRVYVADRGDNLVRIYGPDGALVARVQLPAPTSVAALGNDEFAVTQMRSEKLVSVYDVRGKFLREFGDPAQVANRDDLNRFLNIGQLASDSAGNLYYAFSFLPEPTARKYDRYGYGAYEASLNTLDFYPSAQAARREIQRQEDSGAAPVLKPIITAIGVDRATQELWMAVGSILLHFDRDGERLASYRTYTPEGVHVETVAMLIEPDRILLGCDPLGIFEYARPDKVATESH